MKASFEQAIGVIRQLREGNERLRAERDLLRVKRSDVFMKKLMDENDMLCIERQRLVEESMDAVKQHLEDTKELIAARRGD